MNNLKLQEALSADLERKELYFNHSLSTVALFGLVVLPLIPGSLSFASIVAHFPDLLGIPTWLAYFIAAFTAIGVEVLGLTVIKLALRMRKYNQKAAVHGLHHAPIGQGWGAAIIYLSTVLALVVLLKVFPHLAVWALIPLACLGAIADWAFALQGDQGEREAELRRLMAQQEAERERDSEIERLNADLADRQVTIDRLANDVQAVKDQHQCAVDALSNLTQQFDSDRQQLNTEIVKLTAQLDALRSANLKPQLSISTELNTAKSDSDALSNTEFDASTADINTVRNIALNTKRNVKAQRQDTLLTILMTEFNGQPSDALNKSELAERLNTTRQTIGKDIEALIAANRLAVNGHIEVL